MNFKLSLKTFSLMALIILLGPFQNPAFAQTDQTEVTPENQAQTKDRPPGVIESLKQLVQSTRDELTTIYSNALNGGNTLTLTSPNDINGFQLNGTFLKSLFLHSEQKYLEMIHLNECFTFPLLEQGVLKTALGAVDNIIISNGKINRIVKASEYVRESYKIKCQNFAQISQIFNKNNLKKTVLSLDYKLPKNTRECSEILSSWKKNDYLPYLCKVPFIVESGKQAQKLKATNSDLSPGQISTLNSIINEGAFYSETIPFFQRSYLDNLCEGLSNEGVFCDAYLTKDAWRRILSGELNKSPLLYKCLSLFKKPLDQNLKQSQLLACAKKFKEEPEICTDKGSTGFPALFPKPNCSLIAKALNESSLKTNFQDCPAQLDNTSINNIHRIINHARDTKVNSKQESCKSEAYYSILKLDEDAKTTKPWPLEVCYDDKIENKEICLPYLPGSLDKAKNSEEVVVQKILQKMVGLSYKKSCQVISKSQYKPSLLEYKNGCYIVFDENNCSDSFCPKKIIVDEEEVKGLRYQGSASLEYITTAWKDEKKSAISMMEKAYKITSRRLQNLTEMEAFLRMGEKRIIHGIGCAEDMLPRFFKRKSMNQCRPLTFIIDGVIRENENKYLVTRTAIDDLHSPRLIPWNWIFTSLSRFKNKHPLGQWSLYGIR